MHCRLPGRLEDQTQQVDGSIVHCVEARARSCELTSSHKWVCVTFENKRDWIKQQRSNEFNSWHTVNAAQTHALGAVDHFAICGSLTVGAHRSLSHSVALCGETMKLCFAGDGKNFLVAMETQEKTGLCRCFTDSHIQKNDATAASVQSRASGHLMNLGPISTNRDVC